MRLIVITGCADGVENADVLLQKACRISGPLDLTDRTMGNSRRLQKPPLSGPHSKRSTVPAESVIYARVNCNQFLADKPLHEGFRILKVGIFPRGAVQPKRPAGSIGQGHVVSIAQFARAQQWHER